MSARPLRRPAGGTPLLPAVLLAAALLLGLVGVAPSAAAGRSPLADPGPRPRGEEDALALLQRAAEAGRQEPWSGTQFVTAWGRTGVQSAVVDVTHDPAGWSMVRVRPTVGASPGAAEPEALVVPDAPADIASLDSRALDLLARNYRLSVDGSGQSGERSAEVVVARRLDDGGTAARLWLDDETGLVLRRELLDRAGSLVRVSFFTELRSTPAPLAGASDPPDELGSAAGTVLTPGEVAQLREEGWDVPPQLPHGLTLLEARRHRGTAAGPLVHLAYSDGLATVSVFVQRGSLDARADGAWAPADLAGTTVHVGRGTPLRYAWDVDGWLYVLLADAPPDTADAVVQALPHEHPDAGEDDGDGVVDRVGRGLRRMGSWLNPFD